MSHSPSFSSLPSSSLPIPSFSLPPPSSPSLSPYPQNHSPSPSSSSSSSSSPSSLLLYVNGTRHEIQNPDPDMTLLQFLRASGWTGTKLGCGEGGCGACTVMVSRLRCPSSDPSAPHRIDNLSVNACLTPLFLMDGAAVVTAEGIGKTLDDKLHPVQRTMSNSHGSQCGFCSPGIVMSMYSLLRNNPSPTQAEIEEALDGNLCRCTGYRPILDAFKVFASDAGVTHSSTGAVASASADATAALNGDEPRQKKVKICPTTGTPCDCASTSDPAESHGQTPSLPYPQGCEPIFPPELHRRPTQMLHFRNERTSFFRPTTLEELLVLKHQHPGAKIVVGNTELGIEKKFKGSVFPVVIAATHIPELSDLHWTPEGLRVGMSVTLSRIFHEMKERLAQEPASISPRTRVLEAYVTQLKLFAGTQIRNVSSLGGNIMTASPISDLNPVHMAAGCTLTLRKHGGKSRTVLMRDFFKAYRKVDVHPEEVAVSILIPWSAEHEYIQAFKVSRRREDDIAIVNACMRARFDPVNKTMLECSMSFGGMAPKSVNAPLTEAFLKGKPLSNESYLEALKTLESDLPLADNAPGGMIEYRKSLTLSFFFKFYMYLQHHISHSLSPKDLSGISPLERPTSSGLQYFYKEDNLSEVGKPTKHLAGDLHVTGEAKYTDDIAGLPGTLFCGMVVSTKAHARILHVDTSAAERTPGFVSYISSQDVKGSQTIGAVHHDERVFEDELVQCVGALIGMTVATSEEAAKEAASKVVIRYQELPAILTIEEAIKARSFLVPNQKHLNAGNVEQGFRDSDHVISGEVKMGGQEHFYLETQTTYVEPRENQEFFVLSATQNPTKTQILLAEVLGLPRNRVTVKVKRMGGGFGGKETRSIPISCAVAVAAQKLGRPARISLDRDLDMCTTGQRHPFLARYKVGFKNDGTILALDIELFNNGGWSTDLSESVMEKAILHINNAYAIPNIRAVGSICKTNLSSNTAYRGFGAPQAMFICQTYMEHVAKVLGIPTEQLLEKNLLQDGDQMPYGQQLKDNLLPRVWQQLREKSDFEARRKEVQAFNDKNRWKKRGLSVIPTLFGMGFLVPHLNTAGALVHIYTDGSVLISHAGTEMGQGLHTKMAQIAATELGVNIKNVYVEGTGTDLVINTAPTAASMSSDLCGMAVYNACKELYDRLEPTRRKLGPGATLAQLSNQAHLDSIDLSAHGYHKAPYDIHFDWQAGKGNPSHYFTHGAAATLVEVDVLTGDYVVLRTDIVHDVGRSLNPAVDIGQIEGAFIQGMGLYTLEESIWNPDGSLFTRGPSTYKIPSFNDIPVDFRVSLLEDTPSLKTIHSSKGVGEPPLFLGATVFFALKDAAYAARQEHQVVGYFRMDSPASVERIRMACVDPLVEKVTPSPVNFQAKGWV